MSLNNAENVQHPALPNRPNRSFRVGAAVVGVALVLIVILAFLMIARIEPGFAGVVYSPSGGVEEDVLNQGWHIIAPFKRVTEYPVSTETVYLSKDGDDGDHSFDISTKDGKNVNVDVVYSYHMDPEKLPAIFTKFRGQESDLIEAGFMKDRLKEAIQEVTTQYDVMEVYGEKRSELNRKVFEKFRDSLAPHGIIVETFNFSAIRPDKESLKAIQEKVNAKQRLETLKVQREQAKVQVEKLKIEAQGKAEAKVIEAKAQAEANRILRASLSPVLVQYETVKRWNGQLPMMTGGNAMLNLPSNWFVSSSESKGK
nr:hypothetical protein [Bacillota bacterium]